MSRRKQTKPARHLDVLDDADALQPPAVTPPAEESEEMTDAHVCGKCNEQFTELPDLMEHKKLCLNNKRPLEYDEDDSQPPPAKMMNGDIIDDVTNGTDEENPASVAVSQSSKSDDLSDLEDKEGEGLDLDEDDEDLLDEDTMDEGVYPPSMVYPMPTDSNVKLEKLESTKVAVAQFAENNLPNLPQMDLPSLQTMLYSLHQQQVMQLQLLTQLQQQIMTGGVSPSVGQMMLQNFTNNMPVLPGPAITAAITAATALTASASVSTPTTAPTPTTTTITTTVNQGDKTPKPETPSTPVPPSTPKTEITTPKNSAPPKNPFDFFNTPLLSSTPSVEKSKASQSGTSLDRSQYAAEDPFFKHKCRFCHKVFSSDSGLQIHIRSHTGERPFKCNICGNRFSTRGNLKVHFQRHKDQYPHVKMNPDPVPEHLDHLDRPVLERQVSMDRPVPPLIPTPKRSPEALVIKPLSEADKSPVIPSAKDTMPSLEKEKMPTVSEAPVHSSPKFRDPALDKPIISMPTLTVSATTTAPTPTISMPMLGAGPPVSMAMPPLGMFPFPMDGLPPYLQRPSILPSQNDDTLEQYMEIQKSETSKLQQLVENIETKLTDPNQCAICQRILSCKSALQMHYRTHTGERPFKCKICGRCFTTKGNLKTHMGVHRSKPPMRMIHQCPVCHKQFTNALVLQQHIRMHTGELPKDMPVPTPDMMSYLPFPSFPFMPPMGFPAHPRHFSQGMGLNGELDLRKPMSDLASEHDDDEDQNDVDKDMSEAGDDKMVDEGMDEGMGDDFSDDDEKEENIKDERSSGVSEEHPASPSEDRPSTPKMSMSVNSLPHSTPSTPPKLVPTSEDSKPEYYPYMSLAGPDMGTPTSSYSTSLMALEERVKAIESPSPLSAYSHVQPLQQMTDILRRHEMPQLFNGTSESNSKGGATSPANSTSPGVMNNSDNSNASQGESDSQGSFPGLPGTNFGFESPFHGMGLDMMSPFRNSGKPNTTCNICFKTFACRSALEIHYRSHTKERPFRCDVCERCFSTRGNMRQHMLTHKIRDLPPNSSLKEGETSSQGSASSSSFTNSITTTTSPTPTSNITSTTTPPSATASSAPSLPDASKTPKAAAPTSASTAPAASGPSGSSSSVNGNSNGGSGGSSSSREGREGQDSPFVRRPNLKHVCHMCQKPFSSASALQIHYRTHTGDKPFKCTICGKAFTTKGNLKVHMGTHMWNNSPSRRGRRMSIDTLPPAFGNPDHAKGPEFFPGFPPPPRHPSDLYPFPPFPHFANGFPPKMNEISVIQSINGNMSHLPPTSLPSSLADSIAKSHPLLASPAHSSGPTHTSPGHPAGPAHSGSTSHTSPLGPAHSGSSSHLSPREEAHIKMEERAKAIIKENNNNNPINGGFGELDLSIRKSPPSSMSSTLPASMASPLPASLASPLPASLASTVVISRPSPTSGLTSPPGLSSPPSLDRSDSPRGNPSWVWKTTCHICNKVCSSASSLEIHMKAHMTRPEEASPMQLMT